MLGCVVVIVLLLGNCNDVIKASSIISYDPRTFMFFQVNNNFAAQENHYPFKRSADGSKRVRVPHSLTQV